MKKENEKKDSTGMYTSSMGSDLTLKIWVGLAAPGSSTGSSRERRTRTKQEEGKEEEEEAEKHKFEKVIQAFDGLPIALLPGLPHLVLEGCACAFLAITYFFRIEQVCQVQSFVFDTPPLPRNSKRVNPRLRCP